MSAPEPHLLLAMFEAMAEMEAACGRLAARRLVPEDSEALQAALAGCKAAMAQEDTESYYAENYVFHTVVLPGEPQRLPGRAGFVAASPPGALRRLQLRVRQRLPQSLAEHEAIVAAIVAGDEIRAAEALRSHVIVQGDRFTDLVAGLWAPKRCLSGRIARLSCAPGRLRSPAF